MKTSESTRHHASKSGASLVEAVASLAVLSLCITGACHLTVSAKTLSDQSRSLYQAANIAKNRIERARVVEFEQVEFCEEQYTRVDSSGTPDPVGHFRRSTSVTAAGNAKEVCVRVETLNRITLRFDGGTQEVRSCIVPFRTEPA